MAIAIGLVLRARWENLIAFIGGPAVFLSLVVSSNRVLDRPLKSSRELAETTVETASPTMAWLLVGLLIMVLIGIIITFYEPGVSRRYSAWHLWTEVFGLGSHSAGGQRRTGNRRHQAQSLYFATAAQLGALTAAADRQVDPRELSALKAVFQFSHAKCPDVDAIYANQLRNPQSVREILLPFLSVYGRRSSVADTLIYGMVRVALADGDMHPAEIGLIRIAASMLGLEPKDTERILFSAGYVRDHTGRDERSHEQAAYGSQSAPLSERERHLQTLGLSPAADYASIRRVWRKLALKYHPDKLVSQNLPPEEMEKAEEMMQQINEAYDWLKEHR